MNDKRETYRFDMLIGKEPLRPSVVCYGQTFWEYWFARIKRFFGL